MLCSRLAVVHRIDCVSNQVQHQLLYLDAIDVYSREIRCVLRRYGNSGNFQFVPDQAQNLADDIVELEIRPPIG